RPQLRHRFNEFKLLCAVSSGKVAYYGPSRRNDDSANDSEHSDEWPPDRNVRGALIRWMCVDAQAAKLIDPTGIQIHGARVTGAPGSEAALDLTAVTVPFPLSLLHSRVEGSIFLRGAQIPNVSLKSSS